MPFQDELGPSSKSGQRRPVTKTRTIFTNCSFPMQVSAITSGAYQFISSSCLKNYVSTDLGCFVLFSGIKNSISMEVKWEIFSSRRMLKDDDDDDDYIRMTAAKSCFQVVVCTCRAAIYRLL